MAGYIGTKAVLLSTTAANVVGNADISGALTVGSGVDVTGTVTADKLTVDGDGSISGTIPKLFFYETDTTDLNSRVRVNSGVHEIATVTDAGALVATRFGIDHATGDISFYEDTGTTPKFFWDASAESLGIGTSSPELFGVTTVGTSYSGFTARTADSNGSTMEMGNNGSIGYLSSSRRGVGSYLPMAFYTSGSERLRIDSSGNLLLGKTAVVTANAGMYVLPTGQLGVTNVNQPSGTATAIFRRDTQDGKFINFAKDGTTVGSIGAVTSGSIDTYYGGSLTSLRFRSDVILPADGSGAYVDNLKDLGGATVRFDDIYATNGTIQTSDANEKQQIADLTAAEMDAAKAISKLFKTFKWNDSVAEKGDAARIHSGVIAQEVEAAMADAGLDAGKYAFFISSTWWESTEVIPAVEEVLDEEGNVVTEAQAERTVTHTHETAEEAPEGAVEKNRKGIRYPQLLSFIGAATEQRLASIEARLDALETV